MKKRASASADDRSVAYPCRALTYRSPSHIQVTELFGKRFLPVRQKERKPTLSKRCWAVLGSIDMEGGRMSWLHLLWDMSSVWAICAGCVMIFIAVLKVQSGD